MTESCSSVCSQPLCYVTSLHRIVKLTVAAKHFPAACIKIKDLWKDEQDKLKHENE